jgi:hypothetical protein
VLGKIQKDYSEIVQVESIATTANNNEVKLIKIEKDRNNKGVLFTGMHHGREPASLLMNLYVLLYLLKGYTNNNPATLELLANVNIYFIPMINVDGYRENNIQFDLFRNFNAAMIRKNRRSGVEFNGCSRVVDLGVDLNRNYGYMFGSDDTGSSLDPCKDDFRGPSPFSESETIGVKNFIETHENIKIAFNYHAWGNLLIMPFNYLNEDLPVLANNYTILYKVYQDFIRESGLPSGNLAGNGKSTIGYTANGEASDWMLGEKGIVAFSPELGTAEKDTEGFYPEINLLVNAVLKANLNTALYGIQRASYFLILKTQKKIVTNCDIVHQLSKKILGKTEDEMDAVAFCLSTFKQYNSKIILKNVGFNNHKGKINLSLHINELIDITMINVVRNDINIFSHKVFNTARRKINKIDLPGLENVNDDVSITLKLYIDSAKLNVTATNTTLHYINTSLPSNDRLIFNNPKHGLKIMDFEEYVQTETKLPEVEVDNRVFIWVAVGVVILIIIFLVIRAMRRKRPSLVDEEEEEVYKHEQLPQDEKVTIR